MSQIEVLLLDADGVMQQVADGWLDSVRAASDGNADALLADIFAAERPCLVGNGDFRSALANVLAARGIAASVDEVMTAWTRIEPIEDVLVHVERLRAAGITVALASNQQSHRARYMRRELGYEHLFDHLFFSCDLGVVKPDPEYFELIVQRLRCPAERILFLDDHHANVAAAAAVGLQARQFRAATQLIEIDALLASYGLPT